MNTTAIQAVNAVPGRIDPVDTLRGVATLGILLINIPAFGLPFALDDPSNSGGDTGANLGIWAINRVLFEGSMRGLFSMLFGASVLLLLANLERRSAAVNAADIYYRRTLWLIAFGLVHAYVLLWQGEILFIYGLAGLALFPLRNLTPRVLVVAGVLVLGTLLPRYAYWLHEDLSLYRDVSVARAPADHDESLSEEDQSALQKWQRREQELHPPRSDVAATIAVMQGGYFTILRSTIPQTIQEQSEEAYEVGVWDALGMMLIGMGLLKAGVLAARKSLQFYLVLAAAAYAVGLPIRVWETWTLWHEHFSVLAQSTAKLTYDIGRLAMTLGHVGLVMALCRRGVLRAVQKRLASVGRMALTNYVAQTLLCELFFYGVGLGMYGRLARYQLYYVVLAVWALQLLWSPLWLARFRYGPLEWLWRSLTYVRRQPMRLAAAPAAEALE